MKNIFIIMILFSMVSCSNEPLEHIGQEIIDGKVSAIEPGVAGRSAILPVIYVQTDKITRSVSIPFAYEHRWKVGDSCLLIVEKYKMISQNK